MGWKSSFIIVNSDKEVNELSLLSELGYDNLSEIKKEPFEIAINPDESKVYIGKYKGNLLICSQDLPNTFLNETVSEGETVLFKYFPGTEICALVLHSTVNLWGYSVSKDNHKMRLRFGSSDAGTLTEYGDPLKQELELLLKSKKDSNGRRTYNFDDFPNEPFQEDQVGENFVFELASRYFGENLDMADDLLFETQLNGYHFKELVEKQSDNFERANEQNKWTKYIIIIAIIFIWQIVKRTLL